MDSSDLDPSKVNVYVANTNTTNPLPADDLRKMPWSALATLRAKTKDNPTANALLAPYEHRAYAREAVAQNPLLAIPYAAMVPGYQIAKAMGIQLGDDGAQTPPSVSQLVQGLAGIYDGLTK